MSIPFALGSLASRGVPLWKSLLHVLARTLSLLFLGVLLVNESPDSEKLGWSATLWTTLMYLSALGAFCVISPRGETGSFSRSGRNFSAALRVIGFALLAFLAFAFVGRDGHRIITLSPFALHTEWWGILGLIGWAYGVGSLIFLLCGNNRTALLGSMVLLLALYPADRAGAFNECWLASRVDIGGTLGSQAAITVAGTLLASILLTGETTLRRTRVRFTLLFIAGTMAGAWLLNGLYGISKNSATPSWCLWACAITATLWLFFYIVADVRPLGFIVRPLAVAGENVLVAYLLAGMLPSVLDLLHLGDGYARLAGPALYQAVIRSAGCGVVILGVTAALNRLGFRLKL
jgi:hypothetical protein